MKRKKEIQPDARKRAPWPQEGYRYGYLVVSHRGRNDKRGNPRFWCTCDCGRRKLVSASSLQSGATRSCGRHNTRNDKMTVDVPAYKCIETGEIYTNVKDALEFAGLPLDFGRDFSRKVRFKHGRLGRHPDTGEELHWVYMKVPAPLKRPKYTNQRRYKTKKVVLLNTGTVYGSSEEASKKNPSATTDKIRSCCAGKLRSAGENMFGEPLLWMYYDEWINEANQDAE